MRPSEIPSSPPPPPNSFSPPPPPSNPSRLPEHVPASLPGRATASRTTTTPEVNKIKNIWRTPPGASAEGTGSHRRPAETTHRPLCSRQCLLCSRTTMIAPAPPAAHLPAAEEAERSNRDIPLAGSLGTELRSRATEARRSRWLQRATFPRAGSRRRYQRACNGKCARWTDPQGGTSKGR